MKRSLTWRCSAASTGKRPIADSARRARRASVTPLRQATCAMPRHQSHLAVVDDLGRRVRQARVSTGKARRERVRSQLKSLQPPGRSAPDGRARPTTPSCVVGQTGSRSCPSGACASPGRPRLMRSRCQGSERSCCRVNGGRPQRSWPYRSERRNRSPRSECGASRFPPSGGRCASQAQGRRDREQFLRIGDGVEMVDSSISDIECDECDKATVANGGDVSPAAGGHRYQHRT